MSVEDREQALPLWSARVGGSPTIDATLLPRRTANDDERPHCKNTPRVGTFLRSLRLRRTAVLCTNFKGEVSSRICPCRILVLETKFRLWEGDLCKSNAAKLGGQIRLRFLLFLRRFRPSSRGRREGRNRGFGVFGSVLSETLGFPLSPPSVRLPACDFLAGSVVDSLPSFYLLRCKELSFRFLCTV